MYVCMNIVRVLCKKGISVVFSILFHLKNISLLRDVKNDKPTKQKKNQNPVWNNNNI